MASSRSSLTFPYRSCSPSIAAHWNGVCGLGTCCETDTVTEGMRACRPSSLATSRTRRPVSAIPTTSASVSVGRPMMKYILMRS